MRDGTDRTPDSPASAEDTGLWSKTRDFDWGD